MRVLRSLAVTALASAVFTVATAAVTSSAAASDAPQTLPAPIVVRGPQTFVANPNYRAPGAGAPADDALQRYRLQQQVQAQRRVQEQAFVKKFGYGKAVRLRARRY